mmetsp:Transcript_1495/g.1407  ORF Transcript_1495/g.1407 Transcript_1495/m.1407 type:complete len:233 (+) Transcript_1495:82-780(+)|eukprot:CAMPEP_0197735828 /NCGR_PEP_ID=MMETSP1435-20131217/1144_1 /TAXON_ID=426625 /ORGANISM="Chaetoceros brevis, Strain CCMP164" /LENGTH=232 /DNA_ID=CAMNT_0043323737 /DNA_START=59 /DNA_END=757 /DNA_ORIENTATION=-
MTRLNLIVVAVLPFATLGFAPIANTIAKPAFVSSTPLLAEDESAAESVFVAPDASETNDDVAFAKAESLGRGAAKIKRGKRKSGGKETTKSAAKPAAALTPEETFFEGPPAITETIVPTISILTVIGIIPAAAAWARQAWVRYKITSRRVRVTSGIAGKEMAEIVYPDIIEIRTVKRLFGDGDMVAFLRDGAKFEMRNIPNFEETIEFILKQVSPEVAEQYKAKGDVTLPPQ